MSKTEKLIKKNVGKAIFDYKMIEENDKILVAVSGGKDSSVLLWDLVKRQRGFPIKYTVEAIHIQSDFCTCCKHGSMVKMFEDLDVKYHIVNVPIIARLAEGQSMNCYWCSTQRRMELLKFANENGFTKIALGHHLDDITETLLMNMCYKSEISAMLPVLTYDKFKGTVIRPLSLVREEWIIKFADEKQIQKTICKCPYGTKSKRLVVRNMITELAKDNSSVRENIFRSMHNVRDRYMPEIVENERVSRRKKTKSKEKVED